MKRVILRLSSVMLAFFLLVANSVIIIPTFASNTDLVASATQKKSKVNVPEQKVQDNTSVEEEETTNSSNELVPNEVSEPKEESSSEEITVEEITIEEIAVEGTNEAKNSDHTQHGFFYDLNDHWAEDVLVKWASKGMISGYEDGSMKPDKSVSRAEAITILNKIYGVQVGNFTVPADLDQDSWYAVDVLKATSKGYVVLGEDKNVNAEAEATREDVALMVSNLFQLEAGEVAKKFDDISFASAAGSDAIIKLASNGYISGYSDGTFKPHGQMTRAEFVQILDNVVGQVIEKPGLYKDNTIGNLVINTPNVALMDMTVKGDLYLAEGIGDGDIWLENITVTGSVTIDGGGSNSIHIVSSTLNNIQVIKNKGEPVRLDIRDGSKVSNIKAKTYMKLEVKDGAVLEGLEIDHDEIEIKVNEKAEIKILKLQRDNVQMNGVKLTKEDVNDLKGQQLTERVRVISSRVEGDLKGNKSTQINNIKKEDKDKSSSKPDTVSSSSKNSGDSGGGGSSNKDKDDESSNSDDNQSGNNSGGQGSTKEVSLVLGPAQFMESTSNDGSSSTKVVMNVQSQGFSPKLVDIYSSASVSNVPVGMTLSVDKKNSDTQYTFSLAGKAVQHRDQDSSEIIFKIGAASWRDTGGVTMPEQVKLPVVFKDSFENNGGDDSEDNNQDGFLIDSKKSAIRRIAYTSYAIVSMNKYSNDMVFKLNGLEVQPEMVASDGSIIKFELNNVDDHVLQITFGENTEQVTLELKDKLVDEDASEPVVIDPETPPLLLIRQRLTKHLKKGGSS